LATPLPLGDKPPENGLFTATEILGSESRSFHAYVHIPFCTVKCGYCDFNTYTSNELGTLKQTDFAATLIGEIILSAKILQQSNVAPRKLKTVFFGGGTPSLLPAADLIAILDELESKFGFQSDAEITFEANPDSVTRESLSALKNAGFTRISIGMQSAVPDVLKTLERTHNPENVAIALDIAKSLGFRTSLDLIFGAPGETLQQWEQTVLKVIELDPGHLSAYSLIVEPGTKLARQISSGELADVDEDLQADKYELADKLLTDAGYSWYEISNWSKSEDLKSNHNLAYWSGQDWWGYGPGAHSHLGSVRWWNHKHPLSYANLLEKNTSPAAGREQLDSKTAALERILLESRTSEGMSIEQIKKLQPGSHLAISQLIADGLIEGPEAIAGKLLLTLKGRLLADAVVRALSS
jgi:putative oxygen-independent coproporphyrinogen III oxidase